MSLVTCFQFFFHKNAKYLGCSLLNEKLYTCFTKHSTLRRRICLEVDYIFVGEWMKGQSLVLLPKGLNNL